MPGLAPSRVGGGRVQALPLRREPPPGRGQAPPLHRIGLRWMARSGRGRRRRRWCGGWETAAKRRQSRAWGASPRSASPRRRSPEGAALQLCRGGGGVAPAGLCFLWLSLPGAHAPGFILSPLRGWAPITACVRLATSSAKEVIGFLPDTNGPEIPLRAVLFKLLLPAHPLRQDRPRPLERHLAAGLQEPRQRQR